MIYIYSNHIGFEYDIYHLIRSFLPDASVRFLYPGSLPLPEAGRLPSQALAQMREARERALREINRWEEAWQKRNKREERGGRDLLSHGNQHERSLEAIEQKIADAKKKQEDALALWPKILGLLQVDSDGIQLLWQKQEESALALLTSLAEAEGDEEALKRLLAREFALAKAANLWQEKLSLEEDLAGEEAEQILLRREQKNIVKRLFYHALSEQLGRCLPWGTLSGIRPSKLLLKELASGRSEEQVADWMRRSYLISESKLALVMEIAKRELAILSGLHTATGIGGCGDGKKGYSLYLNIPFCPSTCLYCSFTSYPQGKYAPIMEAYVEALEREIDYVRRDFQEKKGRILDSIYIGGGTPTTLPVHLLDRLLGYLEQKLDLSQLKEWTIEAGRPDSICREKLAAIARHGVTRISINPQTMKEETLRLIGRRHKTQEFLDAYALAREMGFDDINMDLIIGLPGENSQDVEDTLRQIKDLAPDNLTVHSLALKRTARLNLEWESYEKYVMESSDAHMQMAISYARQMGLSPYYLYRQKNIAGNQENIGFAREGKEGIYNILIMEEQEDIVALGCAADSKRILPSGATERCENVKNVNEYLARVDEMIARKESLFAEEDR